MFFAASAQPLNLRAVDYSDAHPEVYRDVEQALASNIQIDTSAGMGRVASDVVWAKLRAMRDGAEIASRRAF